MAKKGHFDGKKRRGTHTTVIPAAEALVKAARRLPYIAGINPGPIENVTSRRPRVKWEKVPVGLKVTVFGPAAKQVIILHTTCSEQVQRELQ